MTALFVIVMFITMILVDWYVRRRDVSLQNVPMNDSAGPPNVRLPEGIFFARNHTWLNLFPSGTLRLGVGDFITRLLARPRIVFLKKNGDQLHAGDPILEMKQNGHHLTVRSPIEGVVLSRNEGLTEHPEYLREAPFNIGWAYAVQPSHPEKIREFFVGAESRNWIASEFGRLKDLISSVGYPNGAAQRLMQDGGAPVAGLFVSAPDELWDRIDHEFLNAS